MQWNALEEDAIDGEEEAAGWVARNPKWSLVIAAGLVLLFIASVVLGH